MQKKHVKTVSLLEEAFRMRAEVARQLVAGRFQAAKAERVTSKGADVRFYQHKGNIHLKRKKSLSWN